MSILREAVSNGINPHFSPGRLLLSNTCLLSMSYGNLLTMSSLQTALDAPSLVFFAPTGTCSLRPSLGATLRAAGAVQIVCPDDLSLNQSYGYAFGPRIKYGAGSGTRWRKKSGAIIASPGEKCGLE